VFVHDVTGIEPGHPLEAGLVEVVEAATRTPERAGRGPVGARLRARMGAAASQARLAEDAGIAYS
jgi:hypothetical protein